MVTYNREKLDKLGNTIIYFAQHIPDLSKTKLLKLLFLLEESFVKKYNLPFLDVDFEVWQAGPVNRETFVELSDEPFMLKEYIEKINSENAIYIKPKKEFSDDEFSDIELNMLDFVVQNFASKSATDLVNLTHKQSSPWYIMAKQTGLLDAFNAGLTNSSDIKIDLCQFYCTDENEAAFYREQKLFNRFAQHFSS